MTNDEIFNRMACILDWGRTMGQVRELGEQEPLMASSSYFSLDGVDYKCSDNVYSLLRTLTRQLNSYGFTYGNQRIA